MTDIIDVDYSPLERMEPIAEEISAIEKEYGVSLGRHVRRIRGILGNIVLFFDSKIGLDQPLRGREWEITYEMETGPAGEGLVALRPGADRPLAAEDYTHLYGAWGRDTWGESHLYAIFQGQLYKADSPSSPGATRLYVKKVDPRDN